MTFSKKCIPNVFILKDFSKDLENFQGGQKTSKTYYASRNPMCCNHQILVLIDSFSIFGS